MGWNPPDSETRRRVNATFGTDMYARLAEVWDASLGSLPGPVPAYTRNQQTRFVPPERLVGAEGVASPNSAHYLGLAYDVGLEGWSPELKAELARVLSLTSIRTAAGSIPVTVEGEGGVAWKPGARLPAGHMHWGLGRQTLLRLGMVPYIQQIVAGLRVAQR
jgi:hypothetical protein